LGPRIGGLIMVKGFAAFWFCTHSDTEHVSFCLSWDVAGLYCLPCPNKPSWLWCIPVAYHTSMSWDRWFDIINIRIIRFLHIYIIVDEATSDSIVWDYSAVAVGMRLPISIRIIGDHWFFYDRIHFLAILIPWLSTLAGHIIGRYIRRKKVVVQCRAPPKRYNNFVLKKSNT